MKYRAGIVGCGRIGCTFDDEPGRGYVSTHAGAYVRTPGVDLVALADIDEERLHRCAVKFDVPGRYASYSEMLEAEELDLLSVCTGNDTHLEVVRAAVGNGVGGVFCEKPIADSLDAADEMIRLCAEGGVTLMVNHQRRFDPMYQQVAAWLKSGGLGRIQQVTCYYTAGVANTGSHLFDLLRFNLGDALWVTGSYSQNPFPNPQDPNIDGWVGFKNEAVAALQACDSGAYLIFESTFLGTEGRLRLTSGDTIEFAAVGDSRRFAGYKELIPARPPVDPEGPHEFLLSGVTHLLDCMRTGERPHCAGADGRAALEMVCALHESAKSDGSRVELPLESSSIRILSR